MNEWAVCISPRRYEYTDHRDHAYLGLPRLIWTHRTATLISSADRALGHGMTLEEVFIADFRDDMGLATRI